jgi:hypothetical protein
VWPPKEGCCFPCAALCLLVFFLKLCGAKHAGGHDVGR